MVMYPLHIAFSGYAIIGLALLALSGSIAVYLLRFPSKTRATRSLTAFFTMVALSGGATILTNGVFYYDRLFAPWQDFWVLAAGIALVQLAYSHPHEEHSIEARAVLGFMSGFPLLALAYCLYFSYRFLFHWTPETVVSDAFYLLLPIGTLLIVIIFLRRSVHFSTQVEATTGNSGRGNLWLYLFHPQGKDATALRNLALALSLAFLPGLQTLLSLPSPYSIVLSNIGSLVAIIAIALVYFDYAPDIDSIVVKLVGISLSTLLLLVAVFGTLDTYASQSEFFEHRWRTVASVQDALRQSGDLSATPAEVAYVLSWEAANPQEASAYRQVYLSKGEAHFDLTRFITENRRGYLETWSQPVQGRLAQLTDDNLRLVRRYWTYPPGSGQEDYQSFLFVSGGTAYEIGFSSKAAADHLSAVVSKWLLVIIVSCLLVLLVFPLFFRRTLVEPLRDLLAGIQRVEQGEFDTVLEPRFNDEIGLLTRSFNRMVGSLDDAADIIRNRALDLEAEVSQRTIDLVQMNVRLEKENKNRELAEARLNRQLLYQKALSGCSQALLERTDPEHEIDQQVVLNRALEHLRSSAQASRAYVVHMFDDRELGTCMGILAEVCASGIRPHINNLANQKVALSNFPADFVNTLAGGNPFGGPVRVVFGSAPVMQKAFLAQNPPLLSLLIFPLRFRDQMWGFIGFDDCLTEREWDEQEISMLRTASEMIGNTLQRWEAETHLRQTRDELEVRVEERTAELSQSNIQLNDEIEQRQLAQKDLEARLRIEQTLAAVSARLLESSGLRQNIVASLADLCQMIGAGRVFLVEFDQQSEDPVRDYLEWHTTEMQPVREEVLHRVIEALSGLEVQLQEGKTIYFENISQIPFHRDADVDLLQSLGVKSLVLSPLVFDQSLHGVLGCTNLQIVSGSVPRNIDVLEVVAGMLKSLLQREYLVQSLEAQVAERTRQLTTFLDMAMLSDQAQNLTDLLQPVMLSITQIAGCDACGIHILNEAKTGLELIAQRGIPSEFLQSLHEIKLDPGFAARWKDANLEGGLVVPEPFILPGYSAFFTEFLKAADLPFGLLSCYRLEGQPFTPFQATLLSALGDLMGIIVENHRLRGEAEELAAVEERQRLAREIHDAISQSVYSLSLFARSAKDALGEGNDSKLLASLQDIETTAVQAMREMRLLLYQLQEPQHDEPITAALNARFRQVESRLGIQATCAIEEDIVLPTQIRHEVWRIIIEALNNSVRYASASHMQVSMTSRDKYLHVAVWDDGIGFDLKNPSPGMGLKNIQARANTLGGDLEIVSKPGQGTQISLNIPIDSGQPEEGEPIW